MCLENFLKMSQMKFIVLGYSESVFFPYQQSVVVVISNAVELDFSAVTRKHIMVKKIYREGKYTFERGEIY